MLNKELFIVMQDDEFEKILNTDPILDELERSKYNKQDEFFSLVQICDKNLKVCNVELFPITPVVWCYLWILDNAFTTNQPVTYADIDMVLYMLKHDLRNGLPVGFDPLNIAINSKGWCKENNIDYREAESDIRQLIDIIFFACRSIPKSMYSDQSEITFGCDWLTDLCSIVHKQTGLDSKYIMFNMSLTECFHHYVTYIAQSGTKTYKPTDAEITKSIMVRVQELGLKYYNDKYGVK